MANGIISSLQIGGGDVGVFSTPYGVCSTASGTGEKTVSVQGDFVLETGARVLVKFSNGVSCPPEGMTLNVNDTGAKTVYLDYDSQGVYTSLNEHLKAGYLGRVFEFVYDGTYWLLLTRDRDTNTTYSNATLGQGYAVCSTTAGYAAKNATLSDYSLAKNGIVSVKFTYGITVANPTLNINSKGAKAIYYMGSALTDTDLIHSDDIVTMIYDGTQYHIIAIDDTKYVTKFGKYMSASGIVLGTDLSSNTVNTYGGGHSLASGVNNNLYKNVTHGYVFGKNNSIANTNNEGSDISQYNFLFGIGNKAGNDSTTGSTGSVAMGIGNTVYSYTSSDDPTGWVDVFKQKTGSIALGTNNTAGSESSAGYAIGSFNTVSGNSAITMGYNNTATGDNDTVIGKSNTVYGTNNIVLGSEHKLGYSTSYEAHYCTLLGRGHLIGNRTTSGVARPAYLTVVGRYSKPGRTGQTATSDIVPSPSNNAGTDGPYLFVIGNGTSTSAQSTAMRVSVQGNVALTGALYENGAADYAECFEWSDGNKDNEDRRGRFVTFDYNETIRYATEKDDYILGIVSATPCIVGDSYHEDWQGRYKKDIYGQILYEDYEIPAEYDEEGKEIVPATIVPKPIDNEDFDPEKEYIPRLNRPEWTIIGMLGKLIVDDDGTCEVNGYARPGKDGIATKGTRENGYRVIARIDETHIKVLFK